MALQAPVAVIARRYQPGIDLSHIYIAIRVFKSASVDGGWAVDPTVTRQAEYG
jgi:hypothetical protein